MEEPRNGNSDAVYCIVLSKLNIHQRRKENFLFIQTGISFTLQSLDLEMLLTIFKPLTFLFFAKWSPPQLDISLH